MRSPLGSLSREEIGGVVFHGYPCYLAAARDISRAVSVVFRWWREAAIASDATELLRRIGPQLLLHLGASSIVIQRFLEPRGLLETVTAVRRGAVGPTSPPPASAFSTRAAASLKSWISAGVPTVVDATVSDSPVVVAARGLPGADWVAIPLAAQEVLGILLVCATPTESLLASDGYLEVAELLAVALANDHRRREIAHQREAAQADKDAALARLNVREIGVDVIGADSGLRVVLEGVENVGPQDTPVLILGETGSGKEVVARAIHARSTRARGPILRVNCGAIPPELIDSELFGHERGSFTGAIAQRRGWFERADGGTLFLDEIGDLPLAAQVRLLRVLQDGVFERIGGQRPIRVDVRIIAATHRDLKGMVRQGTFREDLWYRIGIFVLRIPPLRDRIGDIPALAEHFADRIGRRYGAPLRPTTDDLALLAGYSWPGNVRELAAVIERAAVLGGGRLLDVARALGRPEGPSPVEKRSPEAFPTLDQAVRAHIERALGQCRGRIEGPRGAARLLDLNPHTLRSKMRKLCVDRDRFVPTEEPLGG
jgi:hydrogenase-4 transcriptional activator